MAVELNVSNFKNLIKRGTVNYAIDNAKLIFTPAKAACAMRGTDLISSVTIDNDVLTGLKRDDEIEFCFVNPLNNVLPYLEILRGDMVTASIKDSCIELAEDPHKVKLTLFHPNVVTPFDTSKRPQIDFFVSFVINEQFINFLDKTKRVCASVGRIYLGVKNGYLYARAGGAANELTSEISLNLVKSGFKDVELNFNFKSFICLMHLVTDGYQISVSHDDDSGLGLLKLEKPDASEFFYLMSRL